MMVVSVDEYVDNNGKHSKKKETQPRGRHKYHADPQTNDLRGVLRTYVYNN